MTIQRLHVQLHNERCPDLMLSVVVLGGVTCSTLPLSSIAGSDLMCSSTKVILMYYLGL